MGIETDGHRLFCPGLEHLREGELLSVRGQIDPERLNFRHSDFLLLLEPGHLLFGDFGVILHQRWLLLATLGSVLIRRVELLGAPVVSLVVVGGIGALGIKKIAALRPLQFGFKAGLGWNCTELYSSVKKLGFRKNFLFFCRDAGRFDVTHAL